jgi:hypothetical protein
MCRILLLVIYVYIYIYITINSKANKVMNTNKRVKYFKDVLNDLNACKEAKDWAKGKDWREVFNTCHRGDWLLWLFKKSSIDNEDNFKLLTRAKAHCALTVRHLMKDKRSIETCEVALKYADGLATKEELFTAADSAAAAVADASASTAYAASADFAAADSAAATAYSDSASAAAYAADAAAAVADASADAAYAASADSTAADSATAAAYADSYAAYKSNKLETANICRKHLPIEIWNIKS